MRATAGIQSHLPIDTTDIVFVGNSLTSNFPVYEFLGTRVKNRGVGGNLTGHILQRIEGIASARPVAIFIEAGINDLGQNYSAKETFNRYKSIIEIIRTMSPRTRVIVQSTFPVGKVSLPLMPGVDSLNKMLSVYSWSEGLDYLDMDKVLRKNNALDSACTWDGIHLNYEGYRRWAGVVRQHLPR